MDSISAEELEDAKDLPVPKVEGKLVLTEDDLKAAELSMDEPVKNQQKLASRIKLYLDHSMQKELLEDGYLSDYTRRWVKQYNDLLDSIQKALYGDKSTHLHLHKVTHAHIAANIKKYADVEVIEE